MSLKHIILKNIFVTAFAAVVSLNTWANGESFITIASTTSTENSGLFAQLNPAFTAETGVDVKVVAVGTGKAIEIARNGDADVLFVHHQPSEEKFIADGFGVQRFPVMYNDFVLVGPANDPASVSKARSVSEAFKKLTENQQVKFLSRGDDSGTHKKERSLWEMAGGLNNQGQWYLETGQGMGKTLGMAVQMDAYTLSDRATWLNYANVGNLNILFEGEPPLFNQYGIVLVNPQRFEHIKSALGQKYIDFVVSEKGQQLINQYRINGKQAFFANHQDAMGSDL